MAPKLKSRRLARCPTIDLEAASPVIESAKQTTVPAEWYRDGSILKQLAAQHMKVFKDLIPQGKLYGNISGIIPWCSMCSGSEGDHFVMHEANEAFAESFHELFPGLECDVVFEQVYACELDGPKRKWIDHIVNTERRAQGKHLMCIFTDIKHMHNKRALCSVHDKECPIPYAMICIVSTSCKDLSGLGQYKDKVPVLAQETSPGGSADTFRAFLKALDTHGYVVVFYENSDNIADGEMANLDIFLAEVNNRNFEVQCFLLNAKLFGVPQSRRRFFAVMLQTVNQTMIDFSSRSVQDVFHTLRSLVESCQRQCPPAEGLFYPEGDLYVEGEFLSRISKGHPSCDPSRKWITEHQKLYDMLRLSWGVNPPCQATAQSPWLEVLTESQRSTLILHQHKLLSSMPNTSRASGHDDKSPIPKLMIDLSPSPTRMNTSADHMGQEIAPCIVPTQLLWVNLPTPRVMLARESMIFMGWPITNVDIPGWVSENMLQSLAGNAVSPPVLLSLVMSTLKAVSWAAPDADEVDEDEDETAVHIMNMLLKS